MCHPTPYQWTSDEGLTHVLYSNHLPPSSETGWSSLCGAVDLPVEGENFELSQDENDDRITCEQCQTRLRESDTDHHSVSNVDGCAVRLKRDGHGMIVQARRMCQKTPEYSLQCEPDSFSGDLTEKVEQVCNDCWETYVEHQWRPRDGGGELVIEAIGDGLRSRYFATDAQAIRDSTGNAVLRLTSPDGLIQEIPHRRIDSISFTPTQEIMY